MRLPLRKPFLIYDKVYSFTQKDGRLNVVFIKNGKRIKCISYARYLISIKFGRMLKREEQVDHIDGNKLNDNINNLQIISITENNIKNVIQKNIGRKMLIIKCPSCTKLFHRKFGQSFLVKRGLYSVCSRKCQYEMQRRKLTINELFDIGKTQIISEYRKKHELPKRVIVP